MKNSASMLLSISSTSLTGIIVSTPIPSIILAYVDLRTIGAVCPRPVGYAWSMISST